MLVVDERFRTMGVNARILAEFRDAVPESAARTEVGRARSCIDALAARLTRFDPLSELSRLNADRAPSRRVSRDLGAAVRAAIGGAARTGGLVDPTLLGALERARRAGPTTRESAAGGEDRSRRIGTGLQPTPRPACCRAPRATQSTAAATSHSEAPRSTNGRGRWTSARRGVVHRHAS
jgi:hypothetical protein